MDVNSRSITSVLLSLLSSVGEAACSLLRMPSSSGEWISDFCIIMGLIVVQATNAAYMVLLTPILSLGIKPLFLITLGSFGTTLFVLPIAIAFEREKWPKRLSVSLVAQFVAISLGGVTICQALTLMGIKKTSPAIASAMPNLAPGIIFIIAACFRFEKVDIWCIYSKTKILGTLVCLVGAISMSFLNPPLTSTTSSERSSYQDWVIGCLYLLAAVMILSCTTVMQAAVMVHFPAPFSLCAIISSTGAILTVLVEIAMEGKLDMGTPSISLASVGAIVLLGSMVIAICVAFQTWCVKKKGPVYVSIFSPIQTVCSAVLSALFLGKVVSIGSLAGMVMMFFGLYMVLWAKNKEAYNRADTVDAIPVDAMLPVVDIEKPLLSEP